MPAILVVEDEAIVANDIKEALINLGYTVAGTVRYAVSALEKNTEKQAPGCSPHIPLKKEFFDYICLSDRHQAKQVLSEIHVHPGMAKPVRLKSGKIDRTFCIIKGIMSNLSDNPHVGEIVLNGWVG